MPTVHDEEESLCLLAADLQDIPPREMMPNNANTNWTTNDDDEDDDDEENWNEKSSFLPSGN